MNKLKLSFFYLMVLVCLSSCLKQAPLNIVINKGPANIVEFANTGDNAASATSTYPGFSSDFGVKKVGDTGMVTINISYSGANTAPQDIIVGLSLDTAALNLYNNQNGTNFIVPPSSLYSIPTTVVIKKGSRLTQFTLPVSITSNFDFSAAYAIPLKITSSSNGVISSNYGDAIYSFGVRNKYDGHYLIDQSSVLVDVLSPGNSSSASAGPYPYEVDLVTVGANSVKMHTVDGDRHYIANGSSYGEFDPVFTFDGGTNIVSVTNLFGQPSPSRHRSAAIDPSGVNAINSSKNIDVKYFLNQGGNLKATFDEHLKYLGSR